MPGDVPYWGANGIVDTVGDHLFDEPLVLLGEDGAPFGDPRKDVAFQASGPVWVNNHMHVLRPDRGVDHRYLTYALNCVDWPFFISGSTRDKLTQDDMLRATVAAPALADQRAIADYLDAEAVRIDALIAKKRRVIELLVERKRAALTHVVFRYWTSGPRVALKRVVEKVHAPAQADDEMLTAYRDGEVTARSLRRSDGYTMADGDGVFQHVDEGDLVFHGLDGFAGAVGLASMSGKCSTANHVCKPLRANRADFVAEQLRALALGGYIELQASSVRQRAVDLRNWERFGALPVSVPEPEMQCQAADEIRRARETADRLSSPLTRQIELLQEHRQALITAAVTGELDVDLVA